MSQINYRANLAVDDFPLLSAFQGETVIVSKIDQDYELESRQTQRLQKEKQIPQVYYCHNVMPTGKGYQSIGVTQKIAPIGPPNDFNDCFTLRNIAEDKFLYSPAEGKNYVYDANVGNWVARNSIAAAGRLVTVAYLSGETYIFYQKIGCFRYDRATTAMVAVVLTGIIVANINGICAAQGFLLAWDDNNTVYRSQATSPLDFTPDPSLGSGSGIPQDIRGKIVVILPITGGYIVYTTANAVAGVFQQNIRYPFIYREVAGSAGVRDPKHVSWRDNLGDHYAWTVVGMQKVDKSKAEAIFPEITDFIIAKVFEDFDTTTNTFTITNLSAQLDIRVTVIGSRYVVISYGTVAGTYTHAIIYDISFKRYGKIKQTHVSVFSYTEPNTLGVVTFETPKDIVGLVSANGTVSTIVFDLVHTNDNAVIVLGKYQFVRDRLLSIEEVKLENINQDYNFSLRILTSVDGKNISSIINLDTAIMINSGQFRVWGGWTVPEGRNHSVVGVGTFHLTSLQMAFNLGGRR